MRDSTPSCGGFRCVTLQCCYSSIEPVSFALQFCHDSCCIQNILQRFVPKPYCKFTSAITLDEKARNHLTRGLDLRLRAVTFPKLFQLGVFGFGGDEDEEFRGRHLSTV